MTPTGGGMYILKPNPEAFPKASENEHCAMLINWLLGIETTCCGLISFPDGELSCITRRFDRDKKYRLEILNSINTSNHIHVLVSDNGNSLEN